MTDPEHPGGSNNPLKTIGRAFGAAIYGLDRGIAHFEAIVLSYGVLIMAVNSMANVVGRFVFGRRIYFSNELNAFLMVLITFMGLGYAARRGRHIRMSAIYDQLPDIGRKILMIIISLITAAVMFVLAYYAGSYVHRLWELEKVTSSLRFPMWIMYLWVPLGFVIAGIQYLLTAYQNLRSSEVYISYEFIDSYGESDEIKG
ncbi:MAG: TRAP transporter small permease [Halofilum sp. (in: g-proteobacteria)]